MQIAWLAPSRSNRLLIWKTNIVINSNTHLFLCHCTQRYGNQGGSAPPIACSCTITISLLARSMPTLFVCLYTWHQLTMPVHMRPHAMCTRLSWHCLFCACLTNASSIMVGWVLHIPCHIHVYMCTWTLPTLRNASLYTIYSTRCIQLLRCPGQRSHITS